MEGVSPSFFPPRGYLNAHPFCSYDYDEVTIQTLESMELSDPSILLETFYKAAKSECLDLKPRKNGRYVVLQVAANAGWNSQGLFVKSES